LPKTCPSRDAKRKSFKPGMHKEGKALTRSKKNKEGACIPERGKEQQGGEKNLMLLYSSPNAFDWEGVNERGKACVERSGRPTASAIASGSREVKKKKEGATCWHTKKGIAARENITFFAT